MFKFYIKQLKSENYNNFFQNFIFFKDYVLTYLYDSGIILQSRYEIVLPLYVYILKCKILVVHKRFKLNYVIN